MRSFWLERNFSEVLPDTTSLRDLSVNLLTELLTIAKNKFRLMTIIKYIQDMIYTKYISIIFS